MVDDSRKYSGRAAVLRGHYGEGYAIETKTISQDMGPLDALVRLQVSGVCSGDLHSREGGPPAPQQPLRPLVGGHEGVGTVVRLGSAAEEVSGIKVGDLVGLGWRHSTCGRCRQCLEGAENCCADQVVNGLYTDGTFQEYIVAPALHVVPIPTGLDPVSAAPVLCGGATTLAALRNGDISVGNWVAISGAAGGLGHLAIQYAKVMGAHVVAIDGPQPEKEDFCVSLGADAFVNFDKVPNVPAAVVRASSGGVHAAIILNANGASYIQAFQYCRPLGRVIGLAATKLDCHLGLMFAKGLWLHTQTNAKRTDILDALALAAAGKIKVVTEVLKLEDINSALDRIKEAKVTGRLVVSIS